MMTPLGEASRGHRYPVTVAWFVAGATVGGACLGAGMATLAVAVRSLSPTSRIAAMATVAAAVVTIASDLRLGGFALPRIPRQVNEAWLNRYRGWVYGAGYGWQIGAGLTTYVMTSGVYLMIVLSALSGRPAIAFAIGTGFGLVRGLAVLLGARRSTPDAIRILHRRIESAARTSLAVAVIVQVAVLVAGGLALGEDRSAATYALVTVGASVVVWSLVGRHLSGRGRKFWDRVDPVESRS